MHLIQILVLALIQGAAELLPVSSSAHVVVASKLLGLDPSSPEMTFFIVMLHTGTMFAVIFYFWNRWKTLASNDLGVLIKWIVVATACTGVIGFGLKILIEKAIFEKMLGHAHGEVEQLFSNMPLIAVALFCAGLLILWAGRRTSAPSPAPVPCGGGGTDPGADSSARRPVGHEPLAGGISAEVRSPSISTSSETARSKCVVPAEMDDRKAIQIGVVQALCLPFRGFSRSGATISVGLLLGLPRAFSEDFSFALAVVLTPAVILLELRRLLKSAHAATVASPLHLSHLVAPGFLGMFFSFLAGLLALKWLSAWLERGRWAYFGYYCLFFSMVVGALAIMGY